MPHERVAVAMSGGVDSSMAAAFLKKKGFDVIGITVRFGTKENRCCADRDIEDARDVSSRLGIPHTVIDLAAPFEQHVIRYFVSEYLKGRTPNPCAVCNPRIKFGALLRQALSQGAQFLATGHYAGVRFDARSGRYFLKRGKERGKDQSYFLARLDQEALSRAMFPIGSYPKKKIRALAQKWGLPVHAKAESQEVCFIPDGHVASFVEAASGLEAVPGDIVDRDGRTIGRHAGIAGFTVGQRKGLGISSPRPLYVTEIQAGTRRIVTGEERDLYRSELVCSDPNWIMIPALEAPMDVLARIRYKHRPARARIFPAENGTVRVVFQSAQRAITPGQLAVFYSGEFVVGSGWIDSACSS